jgi:hypothetical protein
MRTTTTTTNRPTLVSEERDDGTLHIRVGSRAPITNTVRFNRDADVARRHVTWMLALAIPLCLIAVHMGSIETWVSHTSASWNHMWSQARASWVQMHQVYQQLHSHTGSAQ